jgi:hypothetical protein
MAIVDNTAKDLAGMIVVAADNSLKTTGTVYVIIRLEDDGDADDGKFWRSAASWETTIANANAPTATHLYGGLWFYALPAGASNGHAGGSISYTFTDNIDTPASATVVASSGEHLITAEDPLSTSDIPTAAANADAVWDELLTGASHNTATSAGRRLRELSSRVVTSDTAQGAGTGNNQIQLDAAASATDNAYDPGIVYIETGTGAGQSRLILEYDGTTKTCTVDRDWRTNPDNTSAYVIVSDPGREHVNEGLAQAGTASTITLNALASADDDAYNGQVIFIRSGTGADQARRVEDYNGTTKVATIETGHNWDTTPDTTSGYVMLPSSLFDVHTMNRIADEVWDEAIADHTSAGSTGEALSSLATASLSVASGISYEHRAMRRQKARYNSANSDNTLKYQRVLNGAKVTPSAVTVSIYRPGNTTALVSDASMTITGTVAEYSIDTTTVADYPVQEGYRAHVKATISGVVYEDDLYFDVVKHLVHLDVGRDQLVALDDSVAGMIHDGDETLGNIIEAVRDIIHNKLESKMIDGKRLLENMVLDKSKLSIPARYLVLHFVHLSKQNFDAATVWEEKFNSAWREMLHGVKFDVNQDQEEDGRIGRIQQWRGNY